MADPNTTNRSYVPLAIIAIIALVALIFLTQQPRNDDDSAVGAAVEDVGDSIEDAGRDMDPNRTTGERIGDAVDDAGDSIDEATDGDGR